jgi:hypothetical protein
LIGEKGRWSDNPKLSGTAAVHFDRRLDLVHQQQQVCFKKDQPAVCRISTPHLPERWIVTCQQPIASDPRLYDACGADSALIPDIAHLASIAYLGTLINRILHCPNLSRTAFPDQQNSSSSSKQDEHDADDGDALLTGHDTDPSAVVDRERRLVLDLCGTSHALRQGIAR